MSLRKGFCAGILITAAALLFIPASSFACTPVTKAEYKSAKKSYKTKFKLAKKSGKQAAKVEKKQGKLQKRDDKTQDQIDRTISQRDAKLGKIDAKEGAQKGKIDAQYIKLTTKQAGLLIDLGTCFLGGTCAGIESQLVKLAAQIGKLETKREQIDEKAEGQRDSINARADARLTQLDSKRDRYADDLAALTTELNNALADQAQKDADALEAENYLNSICVQ